MRVQNFKKVAATLVLAVLGVTNMYAQGAGGIDAAASELATYIDPIGNLIMVIGGVVGLIGAVRCYIKWQSGDQDVQKSIMGWMGACVFLVVSGVVVKQFFGL